MQIGAQLMPCVLASCALTRLLALTGMGFKMRCCLPRVTLQLCACLLLRYHCLGAAAFDLLAARFDFSKYKTLADIGGSAGVLCCAVARAHPHMTCTTLDLPAVHAAAVQYTTQQGMQDLVKVSESKAPTQVSLSHISTHTLDSCIPTTDIEETRADAVREVWHSNMCRRSVTAWQAASWDATTKASIQPSHV